MNNFMVGAVKGGKEEAVKQVVKLAPVCDVGRLLQSMNHGLGSGMQKLNIVMIAPRQPHLFIIIFVFYCMVLDENVLPSELSKHQKHKQKILWSINWLLKSKCLFSEKILKILKYSRNNKRRIFIAVIVKKLQGK